MRIAPKADTLKLATTTLPLFLTYSCRHDHLCRSTPHALSFRLWQICLPKNVTGCDVIFIWVRS